MSWERLDRMIDFLYKIATLDVFPLFLLYLLLIFSSNLWRRYTKPLELRPVLVVYNLLCSALSLYTTIGMTWALFHIDMVYSMSATPMLTRYYQVYGVTKIIELLDTVFMILRHRGRQISFLHVFHHSSMLILVYYALRYTPWTALAPCLALNSLIHVFLYFYYAYTAYFSSQRPSWKRRLTELQIIQFLIDMMYCVNGLLYHDFCMWSFFYGISMLTLFVNFYIKTYIYPSKNIRPKANDQISNGSVQNGVNHSTHSKTH